MMESELISLLKQNLEVSRETNEILKKMNRAQKWGRFFTMLYWLFIIGITLGAYYYLQGPLEKLMQLYSGGLEALDQAQKTAGSLPDINALKALFDNFKQ